MYTFKAVRLFRNPHTHTQGLYNNSNNNVCYGMKSVAVGEEGEDE